MLPNTSFLKANPKRWLKDMACCQSYGVLDNSTPPHRQTKLRATYLSNCVGSRMHTQPIQRCHKDEL